MVAKKWQLLFAKRAQADAKILGSTKLKIKAQLLLDLLKNDPFKIPPPIKKLVGDFAGYYTRRINIQHRLVYAVDTQKRTIRVISMWHHYGD
jgi:toxin YoeB